MFELIIKNYEWIFSGIGILGITAVFNIFKKKNIAKENNIETKSIKIEGSTNSNVQVANNLVNNNFINTNTLQLGNKDIIYSKNPIEIIDEIAAIPPFQQKAHEDSFVGLCIIWVVLYKSILHNDGHTVCISTCYERPLGPSIIFNINIEDYPIFKVAKKHTKFLVRGKIKRIDGSRIDIDIKSIEEYSIQN